MTADQPTPDVETVLAEHRPVVGKFARLNPVVGCSCMDRVFVAGRESYAAHLAAVLEPLIREREAKARGEALRLVRQVESDMANQAADAWRSADARRGMSDHEALLTYADALTRWSERFRMAFEGEDYRAAVHRQSQP